jgi:hypothetical protein
LSAAALAALLAAPASAESPVLAWEGVRRLAILCQATAPSPHDNEAVMRAVCERAAAIARRQAPVPVKVVTYGDPALRAPNTVSLLVQASVVEVAPRRLGLLIAARTDHRSTINPDDSYFGAPPRFAPFTTAADAAAWDAALAASIGQLLPWLRGNEG